MRFVVCVAVLCACGRLNFEGGDAGAALAITSPPENATVRAAATISGRCVGREPIAITGDAAATTDCASGAFSAEVAFGDPDGAKTIVVAQGRAIVTRMFQRVTPGVRSASSGTVASAGFNVDCDLVIPRPPNLQTGDLLVGMIFTDGGLNASVSTPGFMRSSLANPASVAFYEPATATEPVGYTFRIVAGINPEDTCEAAGVIVAFRNVLDSVASQSANQGTGTSIVARGVTSPGEGLLVGAWGSNGPSSGITAPGTMRVADGARSPDDFANAMISYEVVGDGPTGDRTATLAVGRDSAAALLLFPLTP